MKGLRKIFCVRSGVTVSVSCVSLIMGIDGCRGGPCRSDVKGPADDRNEDYLQLGTILISRRGS